MMMSLRNSSWENENCIEQHIPKTPNTFTFFALSLTIGIEKSDKVV